MMRLSLYVTAAYAADWNYKTNGADWPSLEIENNECGDAA